MSKSPENLKKLSDDLYSKNIYVKSLPIIMYIESIRGCLGSCVMCEAGKEKPHDISGSLLEKMKPYFKYIEYLSIHGNGEPLLSRNIDLFIDSSRENDCFIHMNTTGIFLNSKLTEKLLASKLMIVFSIHAGKAETYKKIMGGDLKAVIRNVSCLVKKSSLIGSKENIFGFSFIVMKENINEIEDFLRLAHNAGIERVRFMPLKPNKETIKGVHRKEMNFTFVYSDQFNRKVIKQFLKRLPSIKNCAEKLGIKMEANDIEHAAKQRNLISGFPSALYRKIIHRKASYAAKRRKGICAVPWIGQIQIRQNGDLNLCCSTEFILGNLYKKNINEIWNDAPIQLIREEFRKGYFPKVCGDCRGTPLKECSIGNFKFSNQDKK